VRPGACGVKFKRSILHWFSAQTGVLRSRVPWRDYTITTELLNVFFYSFLLFFMVFVNVSLAPRFQVHSVFVFTVVLVCRWGMHTHLSSFTFFSVSKAL